MLAEALHNPPSFLPPPLMAGSVFGLGGQLDVQAASLSLIAIVIFTIGFEVFTHHLDHYLEGTAYKEMVDKIYQVRVDA